MMKNLFKTVLFTTACCMQCHCMAMDIDDAPAASAQIRNDYQELCNIFEPLTIKVIEVFWQLSPIEKYKTIADEIKVIQNYISAAFQDMVCNIESDARKTLIDCKFRLEKLKINNQELLQIIGPLVEIFYDTYNKLVQKYGKNF